MAPIGVGIIGGGLFVKGEHLPAVENNDLLSLKAIYSRSLKSAQDTAALITKQGLKPDLYSADAGSGKTYHDLLLREDISAVMIALPIVAQPEYIEAALAAGKHVLAEKPIAKDTAAARKLMDYYSQVSAKNGATFAVAENARFYRSAAYAAEQIRKLGRVTHFNVKIMNLIDAGTKWYKTEWRKTPEYQGGFLLDGGVHYAAATRLYLSGADTPETVQAFTAQVQDYLPPIDSAAAILKTRSGATGVFQFSSGTLMSAFEWDVACEGGTVKIVGDTVTVKENGVEKPSVKEFERMSGVPEEVQAWAAGMVAGKPDARQAPEEALADLELLEKMFRSGEEGGEAQKYDFL